MKFTVQLTDARHLDMTPEIHAEVEATDARAALIAAGAPDHFDYTDEPHGGRMTSAYAPYAIWTAIAGKPRMPRREITNVLRGTRSKLNKNRPEVTTARVALSEILNATQNRELTTEEDAAARETIKNLMTAWRSYGYEGLLNH